MVRDHHKDAITMGIGDGANDVNMIATAHVGIGIEGLEGMQAARASDYAISQFRFVRPLLFYHGREAYRRNSVLALYMFYKNILFVLPQFWFGFASAFSGQTLYEAIIYQGFNIVFTAFPIMWFAMFDEEFTKQTFISEPKHYRIGLVHEYYSIKLLTWTEIKGILNALFITCFVFLTLNGNEVIGDGKNGSFWESSTILYGIVVINANVYVLQRTCTHTWWSTLLISLSIISFYFIWWFENLYPFSTVIYRIFDQSMANMKAWMVLVLALWQAVALDKVIHRYNDWQTYKREKQAALEELEDTLTIDTNISQVTPRGTSVVTPSMVQRASIKESMLHQEQVL